MMKARLTALQASAAASTANAKIIHLLVQLQNRVWRESRGGRQGDERENECSRDRNKKGLPACACCCRQMSHIYITRKRYQIPVNIEYLHRARVNMECTNMEDAFQKRRRICRQRDTHLQIERRYQDIPLDLCKRVMCAIFSRRSLTFSPFLLFLTHTETRRGHA